MVAKIDENYPTYSSICRNIFDNFCVTYFLFYLYNGQIFGYSKHQFSLIFVIWDAMTIFKTLKRFLILVSFNQILYHFNLYVGRFIREQKE